jgi:glycosyltransferase 2 family protein
MLKTFFVNALKITITGALIYWLITSGKLDFKLLGKLDDHPFAVALAVLFSLLNIVLCSYRWETILRARAQVTLPISGLFKITWIGAFFSSVLPGSVTGDFVKILYVQKYDKENFSKKFIIASILIDRVMGLCGIILLVGLSSLIFSKKIMETTPAMEPLLKMNYVLMSLVVISVLIFFFANRFVRTLLVLFQKIAFSKIFGQIITLWDDLVIIKSKLLRGVALSIVVQFIAVLIFWSLIYPFVRESMDFVQALAFIPTGLMSLAIPIAPSGLGVGHAIFQKLFELSGISNGASLFNLYFVVTLVVNVTGSIPYLLTKTQK